MEYRASRAFSPAFFSFRVSSVSRSAPYRTAGVGQDRDAACSENEADGLLGSRLFPGYEAGAAIAQIAVEGFADGGDIALFKEHASEMGPGQYRVLP